MNTNLPQTNWYAVCVKPKLERKVAACLAKQGFETFLPMKKAPHSGWSFFRKPELEPLFPALLFVRTQESRLDTLRQNPYVLSFLYWLDAPAVINEADIVMIKEFLQQHNEVRIAHIPVRKRAIVDAEEGEDRPGLQALFSNNTVMTSLSSLGYLLIADGPKQEVSINETNKADVKQLYPQYLVNDAG